MNSKCITFLPKIHLNFYNRYREEKATSDLVLKEMESELTRLRKDLNERSQNHMQNNEDVRIDEFMKELTEMKERNRSLEETNDELQALLLTRGVEQGINLLNGTSASLAKELEAMGQAQVCLFFYIQTNFIV